MRKHASFIRWAQRHVEPVYECVFCGYETRHPSRTCPAHRDLAPRIDDPIFDDDDDSGLHSRPDVVSD